MNGIVQTPDICHCQIRWQRHHWWAWAAWAIEEQATQIHRVWALQVQDSAAAEVEPARRKAVSVKVELRCNCSRESAQVERAHMHLIE